MPKSAARAKAALARGEAVYDDGRDHRGLLPEIHRARRHGARGVHHIGIAGHARERLLHTIETPDGRLELLAAARIRAGRATGEFAAAGAEGGQGDRASRGEALHEHAPAVADAVLAAEHPLL